MHSVCGLVWPRLQNIVPELNQISISSCHYWDDLIDFGAVHILDIFVSQFWDVNSQLFYMNVCAHDDWSIKYQCTFNISSRTSIFAGSIVFFIHRSSIHSKSWSRWSPDSADNLEFPAERLSENAKTINSVVTKRLRGVEPLLPFYS